MIAFLLAALAGVLMVRAHRNASRLDEATLERARRTFAAALVVQSALMLALARPLPVLVANLLIALAAVVGMIGWNALSRLVAVRTRGQDLFVLIPLLVAAGVTMAANGAWLAVAILAGVAVASAHRWTKGLPTRRLFALAWVAMALAVLGFWQFQAPEAFRDSLEGGRRALWSFASATRWIAAVYATQGAFSLFVAFVRDPSLGVRRVGRRLALSHVLVVLVPLTLLALLWVATTVLGVGRDRALVAARTLEGEADALEGGLRASLAGPGDARPRLAALGDLWDSRAPGTRVWLRGPSGLTRVRGDSIPDEAGLAAWLDSLSILPASGVVKRRGGATYVGAAVRERGREAIALAPSDGLERLASRVADAGVRLLTGSIGTPDDADSLGLAVDSLARASRARRAARAESLATNDSLEIEQLRKMTRRFGIPDAAVQPSPPERGRGPRLTSRGQSFETAPDDSFKTSDLLDGYALARGLRELKHGGWRSSHALVAASISPARALRGLIDNPRRDQFGYVPLFVLATLALMFAFVVVWDVVMVSSMGRGVASAIGALHGAARRLQAGDLTHRIEVKGDDDLWDVGLALNQATRGLADAREAEKQRERLESEMALARRIQARLLPEAPPEIAGLEIAGASESAREVGGDYFDHIDLGGGRVALVIADVSGKGVPAALIMSAFRAALVSHDLAHAEPAALAARLNDFLHRSVDPGKFVTAFIGILEAASGELRYVNAGHNPPVLLRADGSHEWLSVGGTILGILTPSAFASGTATLGPGDLLALYTDGVTEGANASGEMWGEERLLAALRRLRGRPADEVVRTLVAEVRAFEGESGPADDITVLVARRTG